MNDLLGGAIRGKTRPRGFVDWKPQAASLGLLDQVRDVLEEYTAFLPLTCRQVFYRLVGAHGYDKTERAYDRLCEMLNRARRAELIEMDAIRDDGGQRIEPQAWDDAEHFIGAVRKQAERIRLDRQEGQPTRLVLLCEAAGMAPQLARAVEDYGLPVISSGGFESVTEKHRLAIELSQCPEPVEVLHIGDHDPSGAHLFLALAEDVEAFGLRYGLLVTFIRLAVTPDQIAALALPTAPAKVSDNRAFGGETCQAEAIAPDVLARIVQDAVDERLDRAAFDAVLERELAARARLKRRLK
jgi:hypothetical protein